MNLDILKTLPGAVTHVTAEDVTHVTQAKTKKVTGNTEGGGE